MLAPTPPGLRPALQAVCSFLVGTGREPYSCSVLALMKQHLQNVESPGKNTERPLLFHLPVLMPAPDFPRVSILLSSLLSAPVLLYKVSRVNGSVMQLEGNVNPASEIQATTMGVNQGQGQSRWSRKT